MSDELTNGSLSEDHGRRLRGPYPSCRVEGTRWSPTEEVVSSIRGPINRLYSRISPHLERR